LKDCEQILPEAIGVAIGKKSLNCNVGPPPDGNGACKQPATLGRHRYETATAVRRVHRDLKETPALQWFEGGGQRRPVHSKERRYCPDVWWFWAVQGHH